MKTRQVKIVILLIVAVSFVASGVAVAKSMPTFEGTFQGANCVVHNATCPKNNQDPHVALENDFVLLAASGDYYFLPNISRSLKVKYVGKNVKLSGKAKGHSIVVADIAVKNGNRYNSVWNWAKIVEEMSKN